MAENILTQEYLNSLFEYKDGKLFNKIYRNRNSKQGQESGHLQSDGYIRLVINKKAYLIHRIIYFIEYGYIPKELDHIDNNRANNRIENLRPVNRSENMQNRKVAKNNCSGTKGVCWNKRHSKWNCYIYLKKKKIDFGFFDDLDLASLISIEARVKYHGKFANHG